MWSGVSEGKTVVLGDVVIVRLPLEKPGEKFNSSTEACSLSVLVANGTPMATPVGLFIVSTRLVQTWEPFEPKGY